ncbi:ParB N-terminal domain-containing protein [Limibaculum sp. FT325]|uniref:ParB N-terminal domain-containing protein n=1 Tax=Thermohalobaculum sediminis TaxID=2939436 RepID=UPI0020BF3EDB|nr:ParB N-terminal domain-containing protein [Limibaculum sediminis]MCL5777140.1 ParB N-terminal domain-containing protein [Limibaculum sediminis]
MLEQHRLPIDRIHVPVKRVRTLDPAKVAALAEDMLEHGQKVPIRCRVDGKGPEMRYVLIEGYHRLEAAKALGEKTIVSYLAQARVF